MDASQSLGRRQNARNYRGDSPIDSRVMTHRGPVLEVWGAFFCCEARLEWRFCRGAPASNRWFCNCGSPLPLWLKPAATGASQSHL